MTNQELPFSTNLPPEIDDTKVGASFSPVTFDEKDRPIHYTDGKPFTLFDRIIFKIDKSYVTDDQIKKESMNARPNGPTKPGVTMRWVYDGIAQKYNIRNDRVVEVARDIWSAGKGRKTYSYQPEYGDTPISVQGKLRAAEEIQKIKASLQTVTAEPAVAEPREKPRRGRPKQEPAASQESVTNQNLIKVESGLPFKAEIPIPGQDKKMVIHIFLQ